MQADGTSSPQRFHADKKLYNSKNPQNASSCSEFPRDDGRGGASKLYENNQRTKMDKKHAPANKEGNAALT